MKIKQQNKINTITIAIDNSSSNSGFAVYFDRDFQKKYSGQIEHKVNKKFKDKKDQIQYTMAIAANAVVIRALTDLKPNLINVVIELPKAQYKGSYAFKEQYKYCGMWIANITQTLILMGWDMINNFKLNLIDARTWRNKIKDFRLLDLKDTKAIKDYFINKAQKLVDIDLINYKMSCYDENGAFVRNKDGAIKTKIVKAHDLAEAIIIGYIYSSDYNEQIDFDKIFSYKEVKNDK